MIFTVLKDGRPFSGDGSKNEQFYCYGQPVLAPADGTVVLVTDSYADNLPGRPDQVLPSGNRVLISHGNQEYSLLMHLKQNSIKVKQGAKVKQGDVVGECGNSGVSPAPHLEYRLQNSKGSAASRTPCRRSSSITWPMARRSRRASLCADSSSATAQLPHGAGGASRREVGQRVANSAGAASDWRASCPHFLAAA